MNNIKDCEEISDDSSSDDDDDIDSSEDEEDGSHRDKRGLQWRPVNNNTNHHRQLNHNRSHHKRPHNHQHHQTHHHPRSHPPVKVVWPPPSNATASTSTSNQWRFDNVRIGNPKLGSKMQLYCKTGHHLAIYPDGKVRGTGDENDLHTYLELSSAGYPGHVRIRGLLTNLYVAMDKRGRLYGENMSQNERPFSNHVRLWCQGYNLTIRPSGEIIGVDNDSDPDSLIEVQSGGDVSLVRLLGTNANLYVCFNNNGQLYGEKDPTNEGTIFKESFSGSYSTFQTAIHSQKWFVGIQKNGQPKKGSRTEDGQKAVRFLPRR